MAWKADYRRFCDETQIDGSVAHGDSPAAGQRGRASVQVVAEMITMLDMRRALVLTHEQARHPFRRRLPRHIFLPSPEQSERLPTVDAEDQDWKLFMLSFAAFFTVAYTFIL